MVKINIFLLAILILGVSPAQTRKVEKTGTSETSNIQLQGMTQIRVLSGTGTGVPLFPTIVTDPPGLAVQWTNAPQSEVGSYNVTATIVDKFYQGSASGIFTILSPPIPPKITITSPLQYVQAGAVQTIETSVTLGSVAVWKVDFFVNGAARCSVITAPYQCAWKVSGAPNKIYRLQVSVYDVSGQFTSASVTVVSKR